MTPGAAATVAGPSSHRLDFSLPSSLEAREPAESRGLTRDAVRMLVADRSTGTLIHSHFSGLPRFLTPGDTVVVNTSATIPASLNARTADGTPIVVNLSTQLDDDHWVVELREPTGQSSQRWTAAPPELPIALPAGGILTLSEPYLGGRLWLGRLDLPNPLLAYLSTHGTPIRYGYVPKPWRLATYQNVYAIHPGSAEMPSAGRPFTTEVLTRLMAMGVAVVPIVLHTGVASLESDELPYPERFIVPAATAAAVAATRERGGRVIAIGTTTVRALESAIDSHGQPGPADGWTDLVITPERGLAVVDGMLTGWHEPEASHLLMLEAVAGRELLEQSYQAALDAGYLWHEFGDVHLILP